MNPDPAVGATVSVTPTLPRDRSEEADYYTVLVSPSANLSYALSYTDISEPPFDVTTGLDVDAIYYWQAIASNEGGETPSDRWEFLTSDVIETYTIRYFAEDGGCIDGEPTRVVEEGGDATAVRAVADSGYRFDGRSDGASAVERTDIEIVAGLEVTAGFSRRPVHVQDTRRRKTSRWRDYPRKRSGTKGSPG